MRWLPCVASQSTTHCRQVSMPGTVASLACRHGPLSTRTSTASMPLCCAHATPAICLGPARKVVLARLGTSMRHSVLIGACWDQPRCAQYANSLANVVTLISVIHLHADT